MLSRSFEGVIASARHNFGTLPVRVVQLCHTGLWRGGRAANQRPQKALPALWALVTRNIWQDWGILMNNRRRITGAFAVAAVLGLSACGNGIGTGSIGSGSIGSGGGKKTQAPAKRAEEQKRSTIWDLFGARDDPNTTVAVNKYIWNASLDVLNFLPIQAADPFSGVIVTGFGTPPGGGRAYRATIYVQDPALDARSLNISANPGRAGQPLHRARGRGCDPDPCAPATHRGWQAIDPGTDTG